MQLVMTTLQPVLEIKSHLPLRPNLTLFHNQTKDELDRSKVKASLFFFGHLGLMEKVCGSW